MHWKCYDLILCEQNVTLRHVPDSPQLITTPLKFSGCFWKVNFLKDIPIGCSSYFTLFLEYSFGHLAAVTFLVWNFQHSTSSPQQESWNNCWILILISDPESEFNLDLKKKLVIFQLCTYSPWIMWEPVLVLLLFLVYLLTFGLCRSLYIPLMVPYNVFQN
jgi:hypothetical protein